MEEKYVEELLWHWLKQSPNVYEVYFNRINKINAPKFRVEGESKELPDFIVAIRLFGKDEYLAIEIKNGDDSINVRESDKILSIYYDNYVKSKTKYFLNEKEVKIDRFLVATQYSPFGKLFKSNEIIVVNETADPKNDWQNKNVPRFEYVSTKGFGRDLIHKFKVYRDKNGRQKAPGVGWLISDIVMNFDFEELRLQTGMKGKPLIQGVFFNDKLNKWSQGLIKF